MDLNYKRESTLEERFLDWKAIFFSSSFYIPMIDKRELGFFCLLLL